MRARTTLTCLLILITLKSAPALAQGSQEGGGAERSVLATIGQGSQEGGGAERSVLATVGHGLDEPGLPSGPDEPGLVVSRAVESGLERPFQLEIGFGWASLMEDPDVGEGFGGGLFFSYEILNRVGASFSFFFSKNPYEDTLGEIGTSFLAGSISLGPSVRLTPAHSRIRLTAEVGLGAYFVIPVIVDDTWTLGLHGGLSLSLPITSWFGVSIKLRYHLFNLATLSGPPMRDVVKSITELGVVDRFEIPVCLSFFF